MKKAYIVVLNIILALVPCISLAAVSFTEIMYDAPGTDTKHEWVELYNSDETSVTLVGGSGAGSWRFNDGSNHYLDEEAFMGSMTIPGNGYLVLADDPTVFISDYPDFSGVLIGTSISMANTEDTVSIINGEGVEVSSASFTQNDGATGDGNSLQRIGTLWVSGSPTPGVQNSTNNGGTNTTSSSGSDNSLNSDSEKTETIKPKTIDAVIQIPKRTVTGVPFTVKTQVTGYSGEQINSGNFFWNMGDGVAHESKTIELFSHVYEYPGEYVIVFEYSPLYYNAEPLIHFEQQIIVSAPGISIANIEKNGLIEIKNLSSESRDLTSFILKDALGGIYFFPKGTVLLPGRSIKLPIKTTKFITPINNVELLDPSNSLVSIFPPEVEVIKKQVYSNKEHILHQEGEGSTHKDPTVVLGNSQSASVISSVSPENFPETNTKNTPYIYIIGILGIVILGFTSFVYLKNTTQEKKDSDQEALDFTIIE